MARQGSRWLVRWSMMVFVGLAAVSLVACTADAPGAEQQDDADVGQQQDTDETDDGDTNGESDDVSGGETDTGDENGPLDAGDDTNGGDEIDVGTGEDAGDDDDAGIEPLEGDTCATAIEVTDGGTWKDESTEMMTDVYDPSMDANCLGTDFSDNDRIYVVAPDETTTYEVRVEPRSDDLDAMIYVREDCDDQECIAGTRLNGAGEPEQVTFDAEGSEETFIIVDGEIGTSGDFDLEVTIIEESD